MTSTDFRRELRGLWRLYSTWVVLIVSAAAEWWLMLPVAEQAKILAEWPNLKHLPPIVGFVAFAVARAKPQGKR